MGCCLWGHTESDTTEATQQQQQQQQQNSPMHRMGACVVLCRKKSVNIFCAYLQGWLKYKMDFLKHLKKLKNSNFFQLHMHHEEGAQCYPLISASLELKLQTAQTVTS